MDRSQLLFAALLTISHLARITNAEAGIYLAINPLAVTEGGTADGEVVKRRLEVNWYGEQPLPDDFVELGVPAELGGGPISQAVGIGDLADSFIVFPGNLPNPTKDQMGFNSTCVFDIHARWTRVFDDGTMEVAAEACLKSEPRWMEENRESLEDLKIGDLMLVGAHTRARTGTTRALATTIGPQVQCSLKRKTSS